MAEELTQEKKTKPLTFAGILILYKINCLLNYNFIGLTALAQALDSK
jgi:hypothetical protein